MSDYTKVIVEADSAGRLNISAVNDEGGGHGYRLAGPKYVDDVVTEKLTGRKPQRFTTTHVLDKRDVEEIRIYLRIWEEINGLTAAQAAKEADRWAAKARELAAVEAEAGKAVGS